jgi:predicted dehydrogenase
VNEGPVGVAVVGAGNISTQYLGNLTKFPDLRVLGIADLDAARAAEAAERFGVPASGTLDEILALPGVELVVNLTIPAAHAEVATAALKAGKHVYGEKPLTLDPASARVILAEAESQGLRVGNAPDTFLGAGVQSAARAIAEGAIGRPVAAAAAFQSPGPERWHPSPEFLFAHGAGPLFDMAPYYLTALVALLGPVASVAATGRKAHGERVIGSGPKAGQSFPVEVPTHVTALLEFANGDVSASTTFSFDSPLPRQSIEITGTEATLSLPDPNHFGGALRVRGAADSDWRELPVAGTEAGRGIGVVDMARALRAGTPHRAAGTLAFHVLDTMATILDSAERRTFEPVGAGSAPVATPEPLPVSWDPFEATL